MKKTLALLLVLVMALSLCACDTTTNNTHTHISTTPEASHTTVSTATTKTAAPNTQVTGLSHTMFNGDAYIVVNNGTPFFTDGEKVPQAFETYADLDSLGRCGVTYACVGRELMPTEKRGDISSVYPSGWKYNGKSNNHEYDFVDGGRIFNRCHLLGFQLTGENANQRNLITGTRYLNINGMLSFENMIADAVKEDDLHVLYRVTPIYAGDNLVAEGVLMEGLSVEDNGETIEFCVFAFNVQPGVEINYATGENWLADETESSEAEGVFICNKNTKKFHNEDCPSVEQMSGKNKEERTCTRDELIAEGYSPCGSCNP